MENVRNAYNKGNEETKATIETLFPTLFLPPLDLRCTKFGKDILFSAKGDGDCVQLQGLPTWLCAHEAWNLNNTTKFFLLATQVAIEQADRPISFPALVRCLEKAGI
jgi:hypothetical protein